MSESMFAGLSQIVGTSRQLANRRDPMNITEAVGRKSGTNENSSLILSGCRREGFNLVDSDHDHMVLLNHHLMIMHMSNSEYYNTVDTFLVLSDSSEIPPEFKFLKF